MTIGYNLPPVFVIIIKLKGSWLYMYEQLHFILFFTYVRMIQFL